MRAAMVQLTFILISGCQCLQFYPWVLIFMSSHCFTLFTCIEPPHDKTNKMACAPSEDSEQPGHLPSLIRVFAVHTKKTWVLSYPLSAQPRLIRLGWCPGWSESLLGAVILLVLSCSGAYVFCGDPLTELGNINVFLYFNPYLPSGLFHPY